MTHSTRRTFLKQASAIAILGGGSAFAQQSFTGEATKEFATLDAAILSCLSERQIAGASLAITKGSKLIYARGFGLTDRELKTPVEPNSLFRIASVSKSLTAVAVLQLVEEKKIELADKAISRISPDLAAHFEVAVDPRIKEITILQCLQHTAGWDRMTSFDPIGQPRMVMSTLGLEGPPMPVDVVRFLSTIPLQFAPGGTPRVFQRRLPRAGTHHREHQRYAIRRLRQENDPGTIGHSDSTVGKGKILAPYPR